MQVSPTQYDSTWFKAFCLPRCWPWRSFCFIGFRPQLVSKYKPTTYLSVHSGTLGSWDADFSLESRIIHMPLVVAMKDFSHVGSFIRNMFRILADSKLISCVKSDRNYEIDVVMSDLLNTSIQAWRALDLDALNWGFDQNVRIVHAMGLRPDAWSRSQSDTQMPLGKGACCLLDRSSSTGAVLLSLKMISSGSCSVQRGTAFSPTLHSDVWICPKLLAGPYTPNVNINVHFLSSSFLDICLGPSPFCVPFCGCKGSTNLGRPWWTSLKS